MPLPPAGVPCTPLAPSVEKAYYRKCIELKRRLNEVEAANDEARVKRVRLDRSIMKMRLERAFLLEQLSRRLEPDVDLSEGSDDEALATPPPDRPHRDKRRRLQQPETPAQLGSSQAGAVAVGDVDKSQEASGNTTHMIDGGRRNSQYSIAGKQEDDDESRADDGQGDA